MLANHARSYVPLMSMMLFLVLIKSVCVRKGFLLFGNNDYQWSDTSQCKPYEYIYVCCAHTHSSKEKSARNIGQKYLNVNSPNLSNSCIYRVMYWNLKRGLVLGLVTIFIGTIFYYAYYQSRAIIAGPTITLSTPEDGASVDSALVRVQGVAGHAKELTLDGRQIFIDLSGNFSEQLLLYPGYNIIELAAKDGEGREQKKTVGVVWNSKASSTLPSFSSTQTPSIIHTETIIQ